MGRLSSELRSVSDFAKQIVDDSTAISRYDQALLHWIGDPASEQRLIGDHPWIRRHDGQRVYSHIVFSGYSVARQSLLHVAKDTWHPDDQQAAYFVGEYKLMTDEPPVEYVVQMSKADARRHLWLQVADPNSLQNWPAGKHPSYFAEPRDQKRLEIDLSADYRAVEAEYRAGLRAPVEFKDIVGLNAMIRQIESRRLPTRIDIGDLAVA